MRLYREYQAKGCAGYPTTPTFQDQGTRAWYCHVLSDAEEAYTIAARPEATRRYRFAILRLSTSYNVDDKKAAIHNHQ